MTRPIDPDFSSPRDPALSDDGFYETMPLATMPHSIYRDDPADYEFGNNDESAHAKSRLTALITLAILMITTIGLLIFVMYGFASLSDQAASANQPNNHGQ